MMNESGCDAGLRPPHPSGGVEPAGPTAPEDGQLREAAWRISLAAERARGNAALRESEERYAALFHGIDDGFCTVEMRIEPGRPLDFRIVEVNGAFERQSTISGARGRWMRELLPACEEWWFEILRDVSLTGVPRRFEGTGQAAGNRRFDVCAFRIGAPQHRRVGVLFKDITEQHRLAHALRRSADEVERQVRERTVQLAETCAALERELHERRIAEQQVRALVSRLVTVQEDERRALARALDDELAQPVTAVQMNLAALAAESGAHAKLLPHLGRLQALTGELDERIDRLMRRLGPAALEDLGLGVALQSLVGEWSHRSGVRAEFQGLGMDGLSLAPAAAVHLYRIAQDALQNVEQHARATHVGVLAERRRRRLVLIVEDNGRGFDPACAAADAPESVGLVSMRARAALLGGEFEVESSPGVGTVVYVRLAVGEPGG
jgi:signal transduction histidine kinase